MFITSQEKQAHHYNQNSGPSKTPFEADQLVPMNDHHSQTWEPGVITKPPLKQPRSSDPEVQAPPTCIQEHGPN